MQHIRSLHKTQLGVALIATLMVVMIVAILGVTVINRTLSAKKSDNSLRDMEAACIAAESALRAGADAASLITPSTYYLYTEDTDPNWYKADDWESFDGVDSSSVAFSSVSGAESLLHKDPIFRIEAIYQKSLDEPDNTHYKYLFKVTAKGFGRGKKAVCLREAVVRSIW